MAVAPKHNGGNGCKISVCSPKAIGLDIVFSGESEPAEDQAVIAALKSHPQIIAASVVQPDGIIKPAPQFEAALKSTGFVNRPISSTNTAN
jgi:CHASE2 domain-containing sensor protein